MTDNQDGRSAAAQTAQMLLDIEAVRFSARDPFVLASGRQSPVYIDCRRIISFPQARADTADMLVGLINDRVGTGSIDNIAGGETAGIPFAALVADRMQLPMTYIRKKPKGYGRNARIEGEMRQGQRVLLLEDLATDGGSKISFAEAIREAGGICTDIAVIFHYGIFPGSAARLADCNLVIHGLCTFEDLLSHGEESGMIDQDTLRAVRRFLASPDDWQPAGPPASG